MVGAITDLLNRGGAQLADERLKLLALGAVSKAVRSEIPNLACLLPVLEALVGGASQPAALRRSALDAYRHILPEDDRARVLLDLLDELDADADSDLDGELRGTLLGDLYPTAVTPTRVWRLRVRPLSAPSVGPLPALLDRRTHRVLVRGAVRGVARRAV